MVEIKQGIEVHSEADLAMSNNISESCQRAETGNDTSIPGNTKDSGAKRR